MLAESFKCAIGCNEIKGFIHLRQCFKVNFEREKQHSSKQLAKLEFIKNKNLLTCTSLMTYHKLDLMKLSASFNTC